MRQIAWRATEVSVITSTRLLGVVGENLAAEIIVDVSALEALFPGADYSIIALRSDGVKKIILGGALPESGIVRVGIPSDAVSVEGPVLLELRAYNADQTAISLTIGMKVLSSPISEEDPEDTVTPPWVEDVLRAASESTQSAIAAEQARDDTEAIAESVEGMQFSVDANGNVRSRAYIGAYETGAAYTSKSGVAPLASQTRAVTRTGIRAKGTGWSIQDMTARIAIAELFRIEYATMDAQVAIGRGNSDASEALATGLTDSIAGHTGREAGTDGATSVLYRGIENFWGNVWEFVDGMSFNGGTFYYCLDQTKFADNTTTNYTALSYKIPTNLSASYATAIGYDVNSPWAGIPAEFSDGSESTYLTDACWSSTAWRVALAGGRFVRGGACGVAAWDWETASTFAGPNITSRLLYISNN